MSDTSFTVIYHVMSLTVLHQIPYVNFSVVVPLISGSIIFI